MGLELNYSNNLKLNQTQENFWDNFNKNTLNEFCLVNNFGSITALKIKFDYLVKFKPNEAEKILELFSVFHKSSEPIKHQELTIKFENAKKEIEKNKNLNEKDTNKINLKSFKMQSKKKQKHDMIKRKKFQINISK